MPAHRPQSLSIPIPLIDRYSVQPEPGSLHAPTHCELPIQVIPHSVYLSGEPDVATLEQFDVVINVAKEISNPFEPLEHQCVCDVVSTPSAKHTRSRTEVLHTSYVLGGGGDSPPIISRVYSLGRHVEYVAVSWDHHSQVVADLETLTALMSQRVRNGKRVLVHCQCGVSRSASLVVAYVMRDLRLDLSAAYEYVKMRSPEISPNLGLMAQLMEWQQLRKNSGTESLS